MFEMPRLLAGCLAITALIGTGVPVRGQTGDLQYPVVFESANQLKAIGIALRGFGKEPDVQHFRHRCYYYGDGGNSISVSEQFLARYVARGFSLNSLCLALQSPLAFHPETGQRLPSYMVADIEALRRDPHAFMASSEVLPLHVPDCYKRGLPYHDCKFQFDITTGAPLNAERRDAIEKGKLLVDEGIAEIKKNGAFAVECGCEESNLQPAYSTDATCRLETIPRCPGNEREHLIVGTLRAEGYQGVYGDFASSGITLIDISPSLPLGFGYQLKTDGSAAPEGGDAKLATDPSRRFSEAILPELDRRLASAK